MTIFERFSDLPKLSLCFKEKAGHRIIKLIEQNLKYFSFLILLNKDFVGWKEMWSNNN